MCRTDLHRVEHVRHFRSGPNSRLLHPTSGTDVFGRVPALTISKALVLPPGFIYLPRGRREFGAIHIFDRHGREMEQRGFHGLEAVPAFVASIVRPEAPLHFEGHEREKLAVVQSRAGTAILKLLEPTDCDPHYHVTTAFPGNRAHGKRVGKLVDPWA